MNSCSICGPGADRAKNRVADELIRSGSQSLAKIADSLGLGREAMKRHRRNGHVAPGGPRTTATASEPAGQALSSPAPSGDATVAQGDGSPLDLMRGIVAKLGAVDETTLSQSAQVAHFNSYRQAVEALAKMEGPTPTATVTVAEVDGLAELFSMMHERLKEFPGAREAMAEVWREHRLLTAAEVDA